MQVPCTQCGGTVDFQAGVQFVTCGYCNSALYIDRSKVVFHYVISPTISMEDALGKLRRWMAGNETVKDLDTKAAIKQQELLYFPMWRFVADSGGSPREFAEPARPFSISEIKRIPLSGGKMTFFSPKQFEGMPLQPPEVLLDSALQWLENDRRVKKDQVREINLIHVPFYIFKYQFGDTQYQAVVDGTSGTVMASIYPAKAELPFVGVAFLSAIVFFVLGLIAPNFIWRFVLYVIAAVPIGILCYSIVRKY